MNHRSNRLNIDYLYIMANFSYLDRFHYDRKIILSNTRILSARSHSSRFRDSRVVIARKLRYIALIHEHWPKIRISSWGESRIIR